MNAGETRESLNLMGIIALETALGESEILDPRQARALELRFYGDLSVAEITEVLSVSKRTKGVRRRRHPWPTRHALTA